MGRPDSILGHFGSKVKLFVITDHSSESAAFTRGRGLLCPAHSLLIHQMPFTDSNSFGSG